MKCQKYRERTLYIWRFELKIGKPFTLVLGNVPTNVSERVRSYTCSLLKVKMRL